MADDEAETDRRALDRLILFSDAVVAIAITLLAIDLPVPAGDTAGAFWTSVQHNSGHYWAFLISFIAIASAWSHHHDIFRYARRMDPRLRFLNTAWLMMIIVNPFATKLLTSAGRPDLTVHAFRFGFYALLQALISALLVTMVRYMTAQGQLLRLSERVATDTTWQSYGMAIGFALSVPVFFATTYAWALWAAGPIVATRVYRWRHRSSRPGDAA